MQVYADNAATTKVSQAALNAMLPYFTEIYGNPSSLHSIGQEAKEALESALRDLFRSFSFNFRQIAIYDI